MTDLVVPHSIFDSFTPDTVAECFNGILDKTATTEDGKWALYTALWASMDDMKPISEQIDIEESAPQDAIGLNTVESVWHKFTTAQQIRLNEIAAAHQAEWDA